MGDLKFNPKLMICEYFEKLINLIDIHTEEQLEKYSDTDLIGEPFKYEFKELITFGDLKANIKLFENQNCQDNKIWQKSLIDRNKLATFYDLTNRPHREIEPNTVRVKDYLNTTRDELISQVKKYEEDALNRYEENKKRLLRSIQKIEDRNAQVDEFKKRLFANKHVGILRIDKKIRRKLLNDEIKTNESPFKLFLVVLDFYFDRYDQNVFKY